MSKSSMVERLEAARRVLGEDAGASADEQIAIAQAEAAERLVIDLERRAERKIAAERAAAEKAEREAREAEARLEEIVLVHPPIFEMDAREIVVLAALRKSDVNTLLAGALETYLAADPRPELRLRDDDKFELSSGNGARLSIGIPRRVLLGLQEAAAVYPPPAGYAGFQTSMLIAAILRDWLKGELAKEDGAALQLVRKHHRLIRESADDRHHVYRPGNMPPGVDSAALERYHRACGDYAEQLWFRRHQAIERPSVAVQESQEERLRADRERAAKAREAEAIAQEQAKLRALIA